MIDLAKEAEASRLRGSLLEFTRYFYQYITGREFIISRPNSRESHHITIAKAYTDLFHNQRDSHGLLMNVPPGYGKSVMTCMWIAWCFAHYADCNFIYISYSHDLASKHTAFIKQIMSSRMYKYLFDIEISPDTRAKDKFSTTVGGTVSAFGSTGSITGSNAGLPGLNRFSGCVIIDDAHKPEEVHSEASRQSVIRNYQETILQRPRDVKVPIGFIGQRLHEDDLAAYLMSGKDVRKWESVILKGIDGAGHALYPEAQPLSYLLDLQEKQPFVFYSQIQQEPVPSGGSLFKPDWFVMLEQDPEMIATFIVADTAETDKSWNDATAFSFFGVYEIESMGRKTGDLGLHWLDCTELRIEPKDLKEAFIDFYANCSLHIRPPLLAAIEKKSTGVTLISVLRELRGMQIREIERTKASGSKTARFLEMQPYIASRRISFTENAGHVDLCIKHMSKITANGSHKHDDICFIKGTKIATTIGNVNIEDITINHKIITPFGIGKITSCGSTGFHEVVEKYGLIGTGNHPIFTDKGFISLDTCSDAVRMSFLTFKELFRWRYLKLLFLMESNTVLWDRKDIILAAQRKPLIEKVPKDCMSQFGNFIAERKFAKGMSFITKIAIILITIMKIWSVFRVQNMLANIFKKDLIKNLRKFTRHWIKPEKQQKSGMGVQREERGIPEMQQDAFLNQKSMNAKNARKNTNVKIPSAKCVPLHAEEGGEEKICQLLNFHANGAGINSELKRQPVDSSKQSTVPDHVLPVDSIKHEVFNLTVMPDGVYYANGALVSNCDNAYDAIKIALIEKTMYAFDSHTNDQKQIVAGLNQTLQNTLKLGTVRYGRSSKSSFR